MLAFVALREDTLGPPLSFHRNYVSRAAQFEYILGSDVPVESHEK
jgi:hypothetical protein